MKIEGRVSLMQIPVARTFEKSHVNLPGTIDDALFTTPRAETTGVDQ